MNLEIFKNEEFGEIRTLIKNNEPWFVGKDICNLFGDTNHSRSLGRLEEEDKRTVEIVDTMGRLQKAIAINESGLYALLFAMQPQKTNKDGVQDAYPIETIERISKSKKFKHWVTSEVLPSIRKHGAYMTDETVERAITDPDFLIQLATNLKEERAKRELAEAKNERNKPKVLFADSVEASENSCLVGELAKLISQNGYDIGQNRLFAWLRENGYLIKRKGESFNLPTQYSMDLGLMEVKKRAINNPDGSVRTTSTTKVTGKGQIYFVNKFMAIKEGVIYV